MNREDRDRILDKIRKCMALSGSSEPHEAAAALRQASALMKKYEVEESELNSIRIDEVHVEPRTRSGKGWEGSMAVTIGKVLGVHVTRSNAMNGATFRYVGRDDRVMVAEYAHAALRKAIEDGRKLAVDAEWRKNPFIGAGYLRRFGDSFAYGFVKAIDSAVQGLINTPEETAAIQQWYDSRGLIIRGGGKSKSNLLSDGFDQGKAAGAAFNLRRPVSGLAEVAGALE